MTVLQWVSNNWPTIVQNFGIIGGLGFTAYSAWKDERARRISNSIAITGQYREIWAELIRKPELARILSSVVDLTSDPVTIDEELFVNLLILHLETVRRAMKMGMFIKLDGLKRDVHEFFSLPIPRAVFEKNRQFQDRSFTKFVDECLTH